MNPVTQNGALYNKISHKAVTYGVTQTTALNIRYTCTDSWQIFAKSIKKTEATLHHSGEEHLRCWNILPGLNEVIANKHIPNFS